MYICRLNPCAVQEIAMFVLYDVSGGAQVVFITPKLPCKYLKKAN